MTLKNRLARLEKRLDEQPQGAPAVIEIYGTREDGTAYLMERYESRPDANGRAVYIRIPDNHRGEVNPKPPRPRGEYPLPLRDGGVNFRHCRQE